MKAAVNDFQFDDFSLRQGKKDIRETLFFQCDFTNILPNKLLAVLGHQRKGYFICVWVGKKLGE